MSLFSKSHKTTYEQALRLQPEDTRKVLTNILTDYIHERISWLLIDLGDKNNHTEEISKSINKYVTNATSSIGYDDAKEILLTLLKNQRFLRSEIGARKKIIEIISGAMTSINLGKPRYDAVSKKRVIRTAR